MLGPDPSQSLNLGERFSISAIESFWVAVGVDLGTSGFSELTCFYFVIEELGFEPSFYWYRPVSHVHSHQIMQIAPHKGSWRGAGVEIRFIYTKS